MAVSVGQSLLFEVLKRMPRFIASKIGNWMLKEEYLTITSGEANIDTSSEAYPLISFSIKIDSKIRLKLKPKELVAYIYLASVPIGKIIYKNSENGLNVVSIEELGELNSGHMRIVYAPSLDVYKSKYAHSWAVKGLLTLSSNLGDVSKHFAIDFKIKEEQIEKVKQCFSL